MSPKKGKVETKDEAVEEKSEEAVETVEGEEKTAEVAEVTEEPKEIVEEKEKEIVEEKEEKPVPKEKIKLKKKEEEEEIVEERVYTVPLERAWISPRKKHSPRAVRMIRSFVMKHMKVDNDSIKITNEINERIWNRGIEKPPRKIRVRVTKDAEGVVTVRPVEGD